MLNFRTEMASSPLTHIVRACGATPGASNPMSRNEEEVYFYQGLDKDGFRMERTLKADTFEEIDGESASAGLWNAKIPICRLSDIRFKTLSLFLTANLEKLGF